MSIQPEELDRYKCRSSIASIINQIEHSVNEAYLIIDHGFLSDPDFWKQMSKSVTILNHTLDAAETHLHALVMVTAQLKEAMKEDEE